MQQPAGGPFGSGAITVHVTSATAWPAKFN